MTRDAFVSYARQDSRETMHACAELQALGIRLWLDVQDAARSRASWRECVQQGIASSRAVFVVLSPWWTESPACRYELALALERCAPLLAMASASEQSSVESSHSLLPNHVVVSQSGTRRETIDVVGACLAHMAGRKSASAHVKAGPMVHASGCRGPL
jgi:hypothetical protein